LVGVPRLRRKSARLCGKNWTRAAIDGRTQLQVRWEVRNVLFLLLIRPLSLLKRFSFSFSDAVAERQGAKQARSKQLLCDLSLR